jgi:uncharacterized protein (DUF1015 family)
MIELRPFRAWRPTPDKAHLVGSRSYISYSKEELADRLAGNPYTFLHVIHPEEVSHHQGTRAERFHRIRSAFKGFCDDGYMERDPLPCIYVYEQQMRGGISRGIIAGVSIAAYTDGRIKVHEQTLTARENLFAEYLDHTGINAEPVLLSTPDGVDWEPLLEPIVATRPDQDFSTTDRVRHRLWAVHDSLRYARSCSRPLRWYQLSTSQMVIIVSPPARDWHSSTDPRMWTPMPGVWPSSSPSHICTSTTSTGW